MSTEPNPPASSNQVNELIAGLSAAIGSAVAGAVAATQPPKQLTPAQYDPRTTAHPNKKTAERFAAGRTYLQNGIPLDWDLTTDAEIRYLNRLTHSGYYIDNLVEVLVEQRGQQEIINIKHSNKTPAHQLALAHKCEDLADMLRQIVKVQEEEDLDEQTRPAPKRRPFGNSKATQEARERAGVV